MRVSPFIHLAVVGLLVVLFVILVGRAYDQQVQQQLRCLPNDPNSCVIVP